MGIVELGHTGVHVENMEVMRDFYTRILGLTVTDEATELGAIFLSSRPEFEHHEFVLAQGRTAPRDTKLINQISWRVGDLESLRDLHGKLVDYGLPIRMVITHGNAISVYFSDPEGNTSEVYWQTGLDVPQPFGEPIDLSLTPDEIVAENARIVAAA